MDVSEKRAELLQALELLGRAMSILHRQAEDDLDYYRIQQQLVAVSMWIDQKDQQLGQQS